MLADSLSHNSAKLFLSQVSQASWCPSRIPLPLIKLLKCNLTWTTTGFSDYFVAALASSTDSTYKTAERQLGLAHSTIGNTCQGLDSFKLHMVTEILTLSNWLDFAKS